MPVLPRPRMRPELLQELVRHLLAQGEQRWLEFKNNNRDPERIGKYISALSNSAAVDEMNFGYLVWGIEDGTRQPVGTTFDPGNEKRGNQSLEFWLSKALSPAPDFEFVPMELDGQRIVLLRIAAASSAPVRFNGTAYIRIGDATPELGNHPEIERRLWSNIQSYRWEEGIAKEALTGEEVLATLDYSSYFRLQKMPLPEHRQEVLTTLEKDRLISKQFGDRWNISNLGAILFAERLDDFDKIARKAVRIIRYEGSTKLETIRERVGAFGYAKAFEPMIAVIDAQVPKRERIGRALREVTSPFSELAIRELVANALVHQDMTIAGAGPMIEIFDNRIEITNPGSPLVDPDRFIDHPPRSRNEQLAALMRRMNICEERGSGIDKVIAEAERSRTPPPLFSKLDGAMRVTLYGPRSFADMTPSERSRACYQHACLKFLEGQRATNASLRSRLGIDSTNAAQVSRVLKQTAETGLIKLADVNSPRSGYVPWWA